MGAKIIGKGECPVCSEMRAAIQLNEIIVMRRHYAVKLEYADKDGRCLGSGEQPLTILRNHD